MQSNSATINSRHTASHAHKRKTSARIMDRLKAFFREGHKNARPTLEQMEPRAFLSSVDPDAPTSVAPLPNVTMAVGDPTISIDLANYFTDPQESGSELAYTLVAVTNPLASSIALTGTVLDLTTLPLAFGNTQITVRATDSQGLFAESSFDLSTTRKSTSTLASAGPSVIGNQTISGHQKQSGITYLSDGSFVMVWDGVGSEGSGIVARQFDSLGTPLTNEFFVSTSTGTGARVTASSEGGFLVTWENTEVYAQVYDNSANPIGSSFRVNTYTTSTQNHNAATYLADGSFIVTWTSVGQSAGSTGIYSRRFDSQGTPLTGEMLIGLGTADSFAQVAPRPDGGYVAVWDNAYNSAKGQIYAQRYAVDDAQVGGLIIASQTQTSGQGVPSVAVQADGSFMVVWTQKAASTAVDHMMYGRRFNSDGAALGNQFTVAQGWGPNFNPNVTYVPGAGYVTTWSQRSAYNIYSTVSAHFRVYGTDGSVITGQKSLSTFETQYQENISKPGVSPNGNVVFGWTNIIDTSGYPTDSAFQIFMWDTAPFKLSDIPAITAAEGDSPITIDLSNHFYDYETTLDKLVYTAVPSKGVSDILSTSLSGSLLTITLGDNKSGSTTVVIKAIDERGLSQTINLAVSVAESDNDIPVAAPIPNVVVNEDSFSTTISLPGYFFDAETPSTSLTYSLLSSTLTGVVNPTLSSYNLNLAYLPNAWGQGDITIRATDAAGTFVDSVFHVTVNSVNDKPVITAIPGVVVNENNPAIQIDLHNYVSDVETSFDALALSIVNSLDANVVSTSIVNGILTLTFAPGAFGAADITLAVTDTDAGVTQRVIPISVTRNPSRQLGSAQPPQVVSALANHDENQSDLSVAPDGTYVVVWARSREGSPYSYRIQAQRFDSSGTPLTDVLDVKVTPTGNATTPAVSHAPDGSFVVVWRLDAAGDSGPGIFAQKFDPTGAKVGTEFLVNVGDTEYNKFNPAIAHNPQGGFVIVYSSQVYHSYNVVSRAYDAAGNQIANGMKILDTGLSFDEKPKIQAFPDGRFVVSWDSPTGYDTSKIKIQQLTSVGALQGSTIEVASAGGYQYDGADVDVAPNGDFIVTWSDGTSTDVQVYAQRYSGSNAKIGGTFLVNTLSTGFQVKPNVSFSLDGSFVIGWTKKGTTAYPAGTFFQAYNAAGSKLSGETAVGPTSPYPGMQQIDSIEWANNDTMLVSYTQSYISKEDRDVFTQQFHWYLPPVRTSSPGITVNEDSGTSSFDLASYFSDPNNPGLPLSFSYVGTSNANLATASVVNSALVLSTKANANGSANISIKATNAAGVSFTGTIAVNVLPIDDPAHWVNAGAIVLLDTTPTASIDLTKYVGDIDSPVAPLTFTIDSVSNTTPFDSTSISGSTLQLDLSARPGVVFFSITGTDEMGNKASGVIQVTVTDTTPPTVVAFSDPYAGSNPPVGSIDVQFSESINLSTFTWHDLTLTRNAGANLINAGSGLTIALVSGSTYRISGLAPLNLEAGSYTLTLLNASVSDNSANKLSGSASVNWEGVLPSVLNLSAYPTPRTLPVTSVAVRLSQPADLATFSWQDLQLTLDSAGNLATSAITITQSPSDPAVYNINIPAALTTGAGAYKLTVLGADINLPGSVHYGNDSFTTWTQLPIVSSVTQPATGITPVTSVKLKLNTTAQLDTFTWQDITLTRDSGANLATSGITIAQSGSDPLEYIITIPSSLTSAVGTYSLTVAGAGITASSGTAFATSGATTWALQPQVLNLSSFTAPRTTPVASVAVRFAQGVDVSTFTWQDIRLTLNNAGNLATSGITITPSGWDANVYTINIPSTLTQAAGDYKLTVVGANITSASGLKFGNDSFTTWTMVPQVMNLSQFTSPRTTPVTSIAVRLSSVANLATFDWQDLTLTLNAGPNLITSAVTIAQSTWDIKVYVITLPGALTTPPGTYQLTVAGPGITTQEGTAFGNASSTTWTMA